MKIRTATCLGIKTPEDRTDDPVIKSLFEMLMKFGSILALLCALFALKSSSQEILEVRLTCEFEDYPINVFFDYACILRGVEFDFSSPFYYIVIEGQHQPNRDNSHVRNLVILESNIDQIPANIFQVFPNLEAIVGEAAGVTAITVPNFTFANTLRALFLSGNNIPALVGSPFWGRGGITHLNLYGNGIQAISPGFFVGLTGLNYLVLSGNNIQTLANTQLAPLINLRTFFASNNQLQRLSNDFFATNTQLQMIGLEYNALDQIGANLFNGLNNLIYVGLNGNECVDEYFDNEAGIDRESLGDALGICISNFIPDPPRDRSLTFELRGNMTVFDEYRRELLHVVGRAW